MYPSTRITTMQTRSQTRNLHLNIETICEAASPRRTSPRLASLAKSRQFHEEEIDTDSSSEYDPSEDEYSNTIDFDEASAAWRANKRACGNGTFKYKKDAEPNKKPNNNQNGHSMVLRSRSSR